MRLEAWNDIPHGYSARYDIKSAPLWLRAVVHTPFVDRFAYPVLLRRGHGYLSPSPAIPAEQLDAVPAAWRIDPPDYEAPGSTAWLT
jgi:hypothetical protein